jgi:hypothetical protein
MDFRFHSGATRFCILSVEKFGYVISFILQIRSNIHQVHLGDSIPWQPSLL